MGFLDDLLNRNPTREWRLQAGITLILDLDDESFCGIRLGERADRLQKFGPADDARAARAGLYRYVTRGFECQEERGRFVEVSAVYAPDGQPFSGTIRCHGSGATCTPRTTEQELVAHLGPPDKRTHRKADDVLDEEVTLQWGLLRTECIAELENGMLTLIWLGTKT